MIFENGNGHTYFIIDEQGKNALLRDIQSGQYVNAYNLDWKNKCWQGASYYESLQPAVERFFFKLGILLDSSEDF